MGWSWNKHCQFPHISSSLYCIQVLPENQKYFCSTLGSRTPTYLQSLKMQAGFKITWINHGCIICKRWTKWGKKNKIKQNPLQIVDIVSSTKFGLILFRSPVSNGESAANINPILKINFSFFRKCRFNWKKCKIS